MIATSQALSLREFHSQDVVDRLNTCDWTSVIHSGDVYVQPCYDPRNARMALWVVGVTHAQTVREADAQGRAHAYMVGLTPSLVRVLVEVTSWAGDAA